jgi:hypothetical protein
MLHRSHVCVIQTSDAPTLLLIQVVELETGAVVRTLPGVSNPSSAAQLACSCHPMRANHTRVYSEPSCHALIFCLLCRTRSPSLRWL